MSRAGGWYAWHHACNIPQSPGNWLYYYAPPPPVQVGTWRLPEVKELAKFTQLVKGKAGNVFKSAQIP